MTKEHTDNSTEVMSGTILVPYIPAFTLFDSGTSYCYISSSFVSHHNILCDILNSSWNINMGNVTIISSRIRRLCLLIVNRKEFYAIFLVIGSCGFDAILRMDWLNTFYAIIDCHYRLPTEECDVSDS